MPDKQNITKNKYKSPIFYSVNRETRFGKKYLQPSRGLKVIFQNLSKVIQAYSSYDHKMHCFENSFS